MRTISLRYTDKFATDNGTIYEHKAILEKRGYVWYGKMGSAVSKAVSDCILNNDKPRFLLIHSGSLERYWVYIDSISRETPPLNEFPQYYHHLVSNFHTWFRVIKIEEAEKNVMSKCKVASSGSSLSEASRHSMSPYFIIDYCECGAEL